jgi:hypothetical protein
MHDMLEAVGIRPCSNIAGSASACCSGADAVGDGLDGQSGEGSWATPKGWRILY